MTFMSRFTGVNAEPFVVPGFAELQQKRAATDIPAAVAARVDPKSGLVMGTSRTHLVQYLDSIDAIARDETLSDTGKAQRFVEAGEQYTEKRGKLTAIVDEVCGGVTKAFPDPGPYQRKPDEAALVAVLLPVLEDAPWQTVLEEIAKLIGQDYQWAAEMMLNRYGRELIKPTNPQWEDPAAKQAIRETVEYFEISANTPRHQAAAAARDLAEGIQSQYRQLCATLDDSVSKIKEAAQRGGMTRDVHETVAANFSVAAQMAPDLVEAESNE